MVAVFLSWDERERPRLAFNPDVFGVDTFGVDFLGVWGNESEDEVDEGGRGIADVGGAVLTILVGREGEVLTDDGVEILGFDGVGGGVAVIELVKLALRAALWGRGLMGREFFSAGEGAATGVCSFFSSSEVLLSRRRVPALTGEGGFAASRITDLGRYFGNAEVALRFLGRRVDVLAGAVAWGPLGGSDSLEDCSSEDDLEIRLRVTVLASGVPVLFET